MAISGVIFKCPLINLDNVGRDIFNNLAASETDKCNGSKHMLLIIKPGCLGL